VPPHLAKPFPTLLYGATFSPQEHNPLPTKAFSRSKISRTPPHSRFHSRNYYLSLPGPTRFFLFKANTRNHRESLHPLFNKGSLTQQRPFCDISHLRWAPFSTLSCTLFPFPSYRTTRHPPLLRAFSLPTTPTGHTFPSSVCPSSNRLSGTLPPRERLFGGALSIHPGACCSLSPKGAPLSGTTPWVNAVLLSICQVCRPPSTLSRCNRPLSAVRMGPVKPHSFCRPSPPAVATFCQAGPPFPVCAPFLPTSRRRAHHSYSPPRRIAAILCAPGEGASFRHSSHHAHTLWLPPCGQTKVYHTKLQLCTRTSFHHPNVHPPTFRTPPAIFTPPRWLPLSITEPLRHSPRTFFPRSQRSQSSDAVGG